MKSAVIVFPGSNCDRDMKVALAEITGTAPIMVWHRDSDFPDVDLITVPGGFSYGDYLRAGAMAAHTSGVSAIQTCRRARHSMRGGSDVAAHERRPDGVRYLAAERQHVRQGT